MTNVLFLEATSDEIVLPIVNELISFHVAPRSSVIQARPWESENHATWGSSAENWIDVTCAFKYPSNWYGFPFHSYSLSCGRKLIGTGFKERGVRPFSTCGFNSTPGRIDPNTGRKTRSSG